MPAVIGGQRVEHEEADEPRRVACDGGGDRGLVARDAGDERAREHAVPIELGDPAIGERLGCPGGSQPSRAATATAAVIARQTGNVFRQDLEKARREEMTVASQRSDTPQIRQTGSGSSRFCGWQSLNPENLYPTANL